MKVPIFYSFGINLEKKAMLDAVIGEDACRVYKTSFVCLATVLIRITSFSSDFLTRYIGHNRLSDFCDLLMSLFYEKKIFMTKNCLRKKVSHA